MSGNKKTESALSFWLKVIAVFGVTFLFGLLVGFPAKKIAIAFGVVLVVSGMYYLLYRLGIVGK